MIGLITTARHERLIAEAIRNAEATQQIAEKAIAGTRAIEAENRNLRQSVHSWKTNYHAMMDVNAQLRVELAEAEHRLAVFTGPRQRDSRGHFLPVRRAS